MEIEMELQCLPAEIIGLAESAVENLLPDKSQHIYEKKYSLFMEWCKKKKISIITEKVLLAYFSSELNELQPSTLWSTYSMLKSTLKLRKNVDISNYYQLGSFLKKKSVGHQPKKSSVFHLKEIKKFVVEAPDEKFLLKKVCVLMR